MHGNYLQVDLGVCAKDMLEHVHVRVRCDCGVIDLHDHVTNAQTVEGSTRLLPYGDNNNNTSTHLL